MRERQREREFFPIPRLCAEGRILLCELLAFRLVVVAVNMAIILKLAGRLKLLWDISRISHAPSLKADDWTVIMPQ